MPARTTTSPSPPSPARCCTRWTRAIRPETVVEFGTSCGISTLYLAAAVTDNGTGHVIHTELSTKKAAAARGNLDEAGVGDAVTILPGPIGLVLLDGWK